MPGSADDANRDRRTQSSLGAAIGVQAPRSAEQVHDRARPVGDDGYSSEIGLRPLIRRCELRTGLLFSGSSQSGEKNANRGFAVT